MHLYIVVDCKTHNCRTVHVLMHLGEKGKTPAKVEYWMAYPLMLTAPLVAGPTTTQMQRTNSGKKSFRLRRLDIRIGSPHHRFGTNLFHKKTEVLKADSSSRLGHAWSWQW